MEEARLEKLVLLSRDEYKQAQLKEQYSRKAWAGRLRFLLGDVRDEQRMMRACRGMDFLIHAAALKRIDALMYNPDEAVSTNVMGTLRVARACLENKVKRAVLLSTDKAVYPINTYGRTKAMAEDLWRSFNYHRPIYGVTRYGNVMGSRGSVVEKYRRLVAEGVRSLPVTDPTATRFWLTPRYAARIACAALEDAPGITLISKALAFRLGDLAEIMSPDPPTVTGLRASEKPHEVLISRYEAPRTVDAKHWFRMAPEVSYDDRVTYFPDGEQRLEARDYDSSQAVMSKDELREALEALK